MTIKNIAVIGLGAMGNPLATRLMKAGYSVAGYDIVEEKISSLMPLGLKPAKSPKEAAAGAELILLSLRTWDIVRDVVEGKNGVLASARQGQIMLDTSTVEPWESKARAERVAKKGIEWLDVPISGAASQVRVGDMVFMAGGKKSVFEQVKPILDKIGKKTVYVGKNGDAAMLKLVVNCVLFLNMAAAIEGLSLGLKAGLDPDIMLEALISGAAGSNLLEVRGKDMVKNNFEPKGKLGFKDARLMLESAERVQVMLPMMGLYKQLMLKALYNGWGELDGTVVMKLYE
jgi:3-hydroxyisobutyrate dehydrogenase